MAKKKASCSKDVAKAAKKAKAVSKVEKKDKKKKGKGAAADDDGSDDDLEAILDQIRKDWEAAHTVTEELVEGPPSRRANATLIPCPNGNHLWCIGGEFFSEDGKAYFYSDVFRYSPEKDEWRKFVSRTCPGPRSAHAAVASPIGGGKIFLFGGEFSSLHQTTFHHYRDFWCFDITSHSWDRIDTKVTPSARSGHRMAIWKHYIVLFGGFYDPGITTRYLNDLWLFDTQEYKWQQVELKPTQIRPSPRSGFSFISTPDGIILHGGYCKEHTKGKRPIGVMLEDTWLLNLNLETPSEGATKSKSADTLVVKWERRKRPSTAYAPPLRSGCTMSSWTAKSTAIMFGGVTDEDTNEETLESVFWNDLHGYQWSGKGKWVSMALRRPKKKGGAKKKPQLAQARHRSRADDDEQSDSDDDNGPRTPANPEPPPPEETDPDDPILTVPLPRYNAMLTVLRNTLYIYGGIYEKGRREYTLDDFYSVQLDKMDRYTCLKKSNVVFEEDEGSSSEDEDGDDEASEDDDDRDGDDDETVDEEVNKEAEVVEEPIVQEEEEEEKEVAEPDVDETELRARATAFMGVSKDAARSPEDILRTPLPGETLAMFYARSREYWSQQAFSNEDATRGKQLRRDGFAMAQDHYNEYKPILKEVEKILAEAGLDEEEMRRSAAGGPNTSTTSRNRR